MPPEKSTDGYPITTVDYNGKRISLAQLNMGHEYAVDGAFDGWRWAANEQQALEYAKKDADTDGEAHAWQERHIAPDMTMSAGYIHALRQGKNVTGKMHTPDEVKELWEKHHK